MEILRIGLAPIKGLRHLAVESVAVDADGVVGDRACALVDPATMSTLKSAENGLLHEVVGSVTDGVARVELADGRWAEQPLDGPGIAARVSYWGRPVDCSLLDGEAAVLLSDLLGREVLLAPAPSRRAFVWDAAVSVVLQRELDELADRLGRPDLATDRGRYRSNLVLDVPEARPGDLLDLGDVVLEVEGDIDRCAVMDHHPVTGRSDAPVLAELARYRREADGIMLGVRCRVVRGGVLTTRPAGAGGTA